MVKDYWCCIKFLVCKVEYLDVVIKIDDMIEEKLYFMENEVVIWYWDYFKKLKVGYIKGINILNFFY